MGFNHPSLLCCLDFPAARTSQSLSLPALWPHPEVICTSSCDIYSAFCEQEPLYEPNTSACCPESSEKPTWEMDFAWGKSPTKSTGIKFQTIIELREVCSWLSSPFVQDLAELSVQLVCWISQSKQPSSQHIIPTHRAGLSHFIHHLWVAGVISQS